MERRRAPCLQRDASGLLCRGHFKDVRHGAGRPRRRSDGCALGPWHKLAQHLPIGFIAQCDRTRLQLRFAVQPHCNITDRWGPTCVALQHWLCSRGQAGPGHVGQSLGLARPGPKACSRNPASSVAAAAVARTTPAVCVKAAVAATFADARAFEEGGMPSVVCGTSTVSNLVHYGIPCILKVLMLP